MSQDAAPPPEDAVPERFRVDLAGRTLLDTYAVEAKLAEGGMGTIYRARDTSLDRPVVVKVPHARFLAEQGFRARLSREIAELVRLEHPHVVRILARGEHDDIPFFVLQYLGGGSLEDRLEDGGRQEPEQTLAWVQAMAHTLDFVHKRGSLHRDVKPGNVLFDEEGHVYLSDFGVAKAVDAESDALTGTGVGIGSPKYMAPEQALGHDVGPAADQYGLASSLYEALTGRLPFDGTPVEILVKKSREDPPPVHEHLPDLPEAAADALMRAMARDPAERFPSCTAFADAFASGLGADATQVVRVPEPTPTVVGLPADWAGRKRKRLLGNLLAVVLVGIALFAFFQRGRDEPPAAPPPPPRASLAEVQLLDAGAPPRTQLRYGVAVGARERIQLLMRPAEQVDIPQLGRHETIGPNWVLEAELVVDRIDEEGDVHFTWTVQRCTLHEPQDETAAVQGFLQQLEGLTVRAQADPRGVVHGMDFDGESELPANLGRLSETLRIVIRELATPLPEEPVGVGARWALARSATQSGMRTVETSEYELAGIDDGVLAIRATTALTAPEQTVQFPGAPEGLVLTLTTFHGWGRSRLRQALDHLAPRAMASRIEGQFETQADVPGNTAAWTGAFRHEVELVGEPSER